MAGEKATLKIGGERWRKERPFLKKKRAKNYAAELRQGGFKARVITRKGTTYPRVYYIVVSKR